MSFQKSTLQTSDAQFLATADIINEQTTTYASIWGIDPEQRDELQTLTANAHTTYNANNEIATKNKTTSTAKKFAFAELKHFLGIYINALEGNPRVPDAALALMGLRPREHHAHQPLPRPAKQPVITVVKLHDEIIVYAAQPEHDQPTAGVAPKRYHAFMIRIRMDGEDTYQTVVSTRLHHTLFFERADEGKRLFISAAWVNPRLEPGPWCEEISEIIG